MWCLHGFGIEQHINSLVKTAVINAFHISGPICVIKNKNTHGRINLALGSFELFNFIIIFSEA